METPRAKQIPHSLHIHDHTRIDPFFWMRDRENPEVIQYLNAENEYLKAQMQDTEALQEQLFQEMKGRIKQEDQSVPYRLDQYEYYTRFESGKEYPLYCRKLIEGAKLAQEEVILDVNKLAEGKSYCQVAGNTISPDHRYLAFAADYQGRRFYEIRIKDLVSGEVLQDLIPKTTGDMTWAADNQTLFYTQQDPETLLPDKLFAHQLGQSAESDRLVYREKDNTYYMGVYKTKSRKYIMLHLESTLSSEIRYIPADKPESDWQVFHAREAKHEYEVEHYEDHFLILSNWQAKNFRLLKTPIAQTEKENWEELIPHRDAVLLEEVEVFKDYLVLQERENGLPQIRIQHWGSGEIHLLAFEEATYDAGISFNPQYDTSWLRFSYQSMTTPRSTYDYHLQSRERKLLKQQPVLGNFSPDQYQAERVYAISRDGTQIPISLVYAKSLDRSQSAPLLLYAYGSYGISIDAYFSPARLSLLDRGFIFAIAHIRGGSEMGRDWYEQGKLLKKMNTFYDFIDCAEHLVQAGYTNPAKLFAMGGSAGGLLMGAVINLRPELFHGVIAAVPFVDVVSTMLDESIPLTTGEYDEWGNPNEKQYYEYMLSYSPYDQVEAKAYPHLLILSGFHDSQVQYWEPTKWTAKLRELKTDQNLLLLKTNMEAGHSGASGRFQPYRETALEYAFLIKLAQAQK